MWDFLTSTRFPEKAEYIEKLIPDLITDPISFGTAIYFAFRVHTDSKGYKDALPGIRTNKKISYKIETSAELPFKAGDIIRFNGSNFKKYTITSIDNDVANDSEYIFRNQSWPGFAEDDIKIKVITLE